jgi:hypothetical protein
MVSTMLIHSAQPKRPSEKKLDGLPNFVAWCPPSPGSTREVRVWVRGGEDVHQTLMDSMES